MINPTGADSALLTLSMVNTKADATLDKSSVVVMKNGRPCKVDNIGTFGFSSFEEKPGTAISFKNQMPAFLMITISGQGCGGIGGELYVYEISMDMEQGGKTVTNSGTISGKYLLQTQPTMPMNKNTRP
jgi:hypothetical protein